MKLPIIIPDFNSSIDLATCDEEVSRDDLLISIRFYHQNGVPLDNCKRISKGGEVAGDDII